jgi:hypothetical protein
MAIITHFDTKTVKARRIPTHKPSFHDLIKRAITDQPIEETSQRVADPVCTRMIPSINPETISIQWMTNGTQKGGFD